MPIPKLQSKAILRYQEISPRREPRWRFNYIDRLLSRRPRRDPVLGQADAFIVEAYKFLRKWRSYERRDGSMQEIEELRCMSLLPQNEGLYLALDTFYQAGKDKTRDMMEAYILARKTDEECAALLHTVPDEVKWYEALFFNVRDRIDSPRYILDIVLGDLVNIGIDAMEHATVIKWFAYWAGAEIADMVADGYDRRTPMPGPEQDKMQFFFKHWSSQAVARASAGINSVKSDQWSQKDFSEYSLRIQELVQKRASEEGGLRSPLEDIAAVMANAVPWAVGAGKRRTAKGTKVAEYLDKPAEPRVSELMEIANGEAPYDPQFLADQKLPPPKQKEDSQDD